MGNQTNYLLFNSNTGFQIKSKSIGLINITYSYKNNLPNSNLLIPNNQLNSYRSFINGRSEIQLIKNNSYAVNYSFYNDFEKRMIDSSKSRTMKRGVLRR